MSHPVSLVVTIAVAGWLAWRAAAIVRDAGLQATVAIDRGAPRTRAVADGIVHGGGRLFVLAATATAVACAIAVVRMSLG